MDSWLGPLLVLLVTAISGWLQKKAQDQQKKKADEPARTASPGRPVIPPTIPEARKGFNWEEELRRLLGEEIVPPRPAAPPSPPPVVVRKAEAKSAAPPKIVRPATPTFEAEGPVGPDPKLAHADAAYEKAQQLHEQTARHLQAIVEKTKLHRPASVGRAVSAHDVTGAVKLVRDRRGVRQALIASVILGPPRAFGSLD